MNEKIRELLEEASEVYDDWKTGQSQRLVDHKMFAELIVQEILRLLEQYSRDSFPEDFIDDFDKGYLAGLCTAHKAVKKHFGVE